MIEQGGVEGGAARSIEKARTEPQAAHGESAQRYVEGWLNRRPGWSIVIASLLGGGLAVDALLKFDAFCSEDWSDVLCSYAHQGPPWILISALAAVPAVLVTWYWRATHRILELETNHRTLKNHEAELRQREREFRALEARAVQDRGERDARAASDRASSAELARDDAAVRAVGLLSSTRIMDRILGIEVLARLAREDGRLRETTQGVLQSWVQDRFGTSPIPAAKGGDRSDLDAALRALGDANVSTEPVDLSGVDLSGAALQRLRFKGANFSSADLSDADFFGTDVSEAYMADAKLKGATLVSANFIAANLTGADLSDCFVQNTSFAKALYDQETKWPEDFDPDAEGAVRDSE